MIRMLPPKGEAVFRRFTLSSGNTYFPNFAKGGEVTVKDDGDAAELQREGWSRAKGKIRADS